MAYEQRWVHRLYICIQIIMKLIRVQAQLYSPTESDSEQVRPVVCTSGSSIIAQRAITAHR